MNLLGHEFFKLKKNRTVHIVFVLTVVISIALALLLIFMPEELGGNMKGSDSLAVAAEGVQIWFIMIAVIVSSIVVAEYGKGQIRNMVMSGHSRCKIFFIKYIVSLVAALVLFTTTVVISGGVVTIINGWGSIGFGEFIGMYSHMLLQIAAVTAIIVLIADLTRSTGAALGANIALVLIFTLISSFGIRVEIDGEVIIKGNKILEFIGDMYVGVLAIRAATPGLSTVKIMRYICTAVVTLVVALFGGAFLFTKRDLK